MKIRKKEREFVRLKYQNRCAYCGNHLGKVWNVDHMLPIRRNSDGTCMNPERHHIDNFMPSCVQCNRDKGSMSLDCWRMMLKNKIDVLNRDSSTYRMAKKYKLIVEHEQDIVFHFEEVENVERNT